MRVIFIFLLVKLIGLLPSYQEFRPHYQPPMTMISSRVNVVRFDYQERENAALLSAYAAGMRNGLTKRLREAHQDLHLVHLFTPSGLHFSAFFLWLLPLVLAYRKKRSRPLLFLLLSFCLGPLTLEGLYSLKRVGLLKAAFLLKYHFKWTIGSFPLFLLILGLDFIFGTYQHSPRSFQVSFLFLGLLFSLSGQPKIFIFLALFLGQVFISAQWGTPLSITGFTLGFFITSLFSLLFPLMLVSFWMGPFLPFVPFEFIVDFQRRLVLFAHQFIGADSFIYPSYTTLMILTLMVVVKKLSWKCYHLVLLLLIFESTPALNSPLSLPRVPTHYKEVESPQNFQRYRWGKLGINTVIDSGERCTYRLFNQNEWRVYCRESR